MGSTSVIAVVVLALAVALAAFLAAGSMRW